MRAERVIFVFLDGVGLGSDTADLNPLAGQRLPSFEAMAGGQRWTAGSAPVCERDHVFVPVDATMGMIGLPQSGTGQATLFTGVNCAEVAGRHWGPYPHSTSKPIIARSNVFSKLGEFGKRSVFANAFPEGFFRFVAPRDRWTVTTRCCMEACVPLLSEQALRDGRALPADLTGRSWPERLDIPVPVITPAESGRRLVHLAGDCDLAVFEYFLTDKAGHAREPKRAASVLIDLNDFFGAILESADFARTLLVVTSDHGNLEDLSVRVHTRNPVPLVAMGAGAHHFAAAGDLTDVAPAIVAALAD